MFNFEKIEVWQKAIDFADFVYGEEQSRMLSGLRKSLVGDQA
jgi:hypothetical protein